MTRTTYTAVSGQKYACVYPGLPILDEKPQWDVMPISGVGSFTSLQVEVDIQHAYFGDLIISLTRESDGATVKLVHHGGCWIPAGTLTFSDWATYFMGSSTCSQTCEGTIFRALESLNSFSTESADGNWRLDILDEWPADEGILNSWCLKFGISELLPPVTVTETQFETRTETACTESITETACTETSVSISPSPVFTLLTTTVTSMSISLVPTTLTTMSVSLVPTTLTSISLVPTTLTTVSLVPTTSTYTLTLLGDLPQTVRVTSTLVKTSTRWRKTKTSTLSKCTKTKTKTKKITVTKCTKTVLKTVTRTLVPRRIVADGAT